MGNKQSSPATPASPKLSGPANKKLGARRKRSAMLQTNRAVANQRAADVVSNHAQRLGAAVLNLKNATRAASKAAEEAVLAVERFIARAAEKNQLHQLLDAGMTAARLRELDEQLTRVADEHGIAVDHDLGALDRAIEMDASKLIELVQTNLDSGKDMFELPHGLIDTLVAIDRRKNQLLDAVLESQRPKLIEMLQATSADIVTRRGRGLSVEYPWSIDHETVEIFPDQRLSKSSFIRVLRGSWQGRDIVVRMFPESRGGDVMSMFLNEVELWYSLNHPNVLKLLGACIDTDWPFTVAPTMNDNILTYIRKNPTTSIEARIGILLDAARGMQYLHEQKPPIVHGNLEAANILLDFEGRAMICDFGLAFKKFGPDDDAMNRRGMTHWNAPEVNDTQYKLELPSDVFAFAMTAIEVLTGERPFAGEPVKGPISEWIVWGERPKRPDGTPDALWSVIEDCWQHNPASRPTFRQVVRRLEVMTPEGAARLEASATHYAKALETIVPQILINAGAARALVELVSDVAAALDESITTGDNDAARSSIGAFRALLSEIDFLFKTTAEKSLLRQMLAIDKTRTGIKQISERLLDAAKAAHLAIELDTSIIVAAFDSDLAALPAALDRLLSGVDKKFDVQTQCLETLHAIERQRDDLLAVVSEEMRNRLLVLLEETSTDIISRAGRSLSSRREWTIDPDDVLILYDRKIGEGGFGEVYPARWNGRDVAVKVFAAAKGPSATMLIEREAFVWSQLQHENVLRLHGVCTDADRPFIVMPFVREDAAGLVTMMQSLSADVSVGILLGVARGMQYLHECQRPVIHGSLKAKAVRIDETGAVLISDFGMSLVKSNSSINTKRRADELRWVAPEVHTSGYKLAKPSDVFAFAMMAVEVLTGDVPFGADVSSNEVVAKIKAGERPARPDGVPDALWQVVEECWQQDPGARPSFAAVVERLKQLPSAPLTFDKIFAVESLSRRAYAAAKIAESCVKAAKVFVVDRAAAVWLAESAVEVAAALSDALKQAAHGLTVDDIQTVVGQIADAKRFLSWIADMNPVGQVLRFKATASRITQLGAAMFAAAKASSARLDAQVHTDAANSAIDEDLVALPAALEKLMADADNKLNVESQRLETLHAIERYGSELIGAAPENMRERLRLMLDATKQSLDSALGKHLPVSREWAVNPEEVEFLASRPFNKGSFGTIHLAKWNGRHVAAKVVLSGGKKSTIEALEREIFVWFPLQHENVLPLLRVCFNAEHPFFVMPLMRDDARDTVCKRPDMSAKERIGILLDTARGMQYLHERQPPVIHGDIKANNVLIGEDGRARICDFGLSFVRAGPGDAAEHRTGAVRWMAPEVHERDYNIDFPSDVFSFSMTAVEVFTGEVPFAEEQVDDIVGDWIREGERPDQPDNLPDDLWLVMEECWKQLPSERPVFRQVVKMLEAILDPPVVAAVESVVQAEEISDAAPAVAPSAEP